MDDTTTAIGKGSPVEVSEAGATGITVASAREKGTGKGIVNATGHENVKEREIRTEKGNETRTGTGIETAIGIETETEKGKEKRTKTGIAILIAIVIVKEIQSVHDQGLVTAKKRVWTLTRG
jgi:hypothetical protein